MYATLPPPARLSHFLPPLKTLITRLLNYDEKNEKKKEKEKEEEKEEEEKEKEKDEV